VNFGNILMGYVYYSDPINNGVMPMGVDLGIKMASSVGTVIGQITFGVLIDKYGRKKAIPESFRLTVDVRNGIDHHDRRDARFNARDVGWRH
jgi:hypothetical protein